MFCIAVHQIKSIGWIVVQIYAAKLMSQIRNIIARCILSFVAKPSYFRQHLGVTELLQILNIAAVSSQRKTRWLTGIGNNLLRAPSGFSEFAFILLRGPHVYSWYFRWRVFFHVFTYHTFFNRLIFTFPGQHVVALHRLLVSVWMQMICFELLWNYFSETILPNENASIA